MFLNIRQKRYGKDFSSALLTLFHASWYSCLTENKTDEKFGAFLAGCPSFFRTLFDTVRGYNKGTFLIISYE